MSKLPSGRILISVFSDNLPIGHRSSGPFSAQASTVQMNPETVCGPRKSHRTRRMPSWMFQTTGQCLILGSWTDLCGQNFGICSTLQVHSPDSRLSIPYLCSCSSRSLHARLDLASARFLLLTKSSYSFTRLSAEINPPKVMAAICKKTLNCTVRPRYIGENREPRRCARMETEPNWNEGYIRWWL